MKFLFVVFVGVLFFGCGKEESEQIETIKPDTTLSGVPDSLNKEKPSVADSTFSNERFREVKAEKIGENKYKISGEARVFEATVSYVVEDGHQELKEGFTTASIGAPEWGTFEFLLEVDEKNPELSLILILFERSAEDGSRLHELIVPLK